MKGIKDFSKKNLASECLFSQILGAITKPGWFVISMLLVMIVIIIPISSIWFHPILSLWQSPWYLVIGQTLFCVLAVSVCNTLTNIFSLRKNETGITWCQISVLIVIGLWIIGFILIFKIKEGSQYMVAIGIAGSLMTWIFKDKIMGAVAFIHLRFHNLLCIGDWIKVPQYDVDGEVKRITLTTVTIYNWDTTTSTIPINVLHTNHFINLQNMMKGKTYGRRMCLSFIFDTSWFRMLTKEQIKTIEQEHGFDLYLTDEKVGEGMLNAELFRLYIFHWLMNHPHISQQPRLIVRWLEQQKEGMPLQIYAFIIDSTFAAFEWQQSQMIEHIIKSLAWFELQLYQSPSAYDVSNSNIYLSPTPATYRKEENNE